MSPSPRLTRRSALSAAAAALLGALHPSLAWARRRPTYGGALKMTLPLDLSRVDPHDPTDLTAALLGPALFDTLYGVSAHGSTYPTLASGLPYEKKGHTYIPLRPDLRFSDGTKCTAKEVVAALRRAQRHNPVLKELGRINYNSKTPELVVFSPQSPARLAARLALSRAAIVPPRFQPERPVGTGAFQVHSRGNGLRLKRNSEAPRGGAFLEEVRIKSANVVDCLRDFEARRSQVAFFAQGLHQVRKKVDAFRLAPIGYAVVQAGRHAGALRRPGLLHSELARLPSAPFRALGADRVRNGSRPFRGPVLSLIYPKHDPWLEALATELARAWGPTLPSFDLEPLGRKEFQKRIDSNDFSLALFHIGAAGLSRDDSARDFFRLGGQLPPRSGRMPSPDQVCRQLALGILGELRPQGAHDSRLSSVVTKQRLTLEDAQFPRTD